MKDLRQVLWYFNLGRSLAGVAASFLVLTALLMFVRRSSHSRRSNSINSERRYRMRKFSRRLFTSAGETTWAIGAAMLAAPDRG
jgi:hypothetical protein